MNTNVTRFSYNTMMQFYIERFVDKANGFSKVITLPNGVECKVSQPPAHNKTSIVLSSVQDVSNVDEHRPIDNHIYTPSLVKTFRLFQLSYAFASGHILTAEGEYNPARVLSMLGSLPSVSNDFEAKAAEARIGIPNWVSFNQSIPMSFDGMVSRDAIRETIRCLTVVLDDKSGTKENILEYYRRGLMSAYSPYNDWRRVRETIRKVGKFSKDENYELMETIDNTFSHSPAGRSKEKWNRFKAKNADNVEDEGWLLDTYKKQIKILIANYLYR